MFRPPKDIYIAYWKSHYSPALDMATIYLVIRKSGKWGSAQMGIRTNGD